MSQRSSIYCLCEGYSEMNFIRRMVAPYLGHRGIDIHAPMITTSFKRRIGRKFKGGGTSFGLWEADLDNLWQQHGSRERTHLTTFLDLYALPGDFPGNDDSISSLPHHDRVATIEEALSDYASDKGIRRFIPYLALHEFETMAYANLDALETLFLDKRSEIEALKTEVAGFTDIEEINSTPDGAPSKRIAKHIPVYKKYKRSDQSGIVNVLEVIDLPAIRAACQHFNQWIERLEAIDS